MLAIVLEFLLRLGLYDKLIKPQSYLGNAVYREKAINEFGLENIDWITVGDSRFDWGLDHSQVLKARHKQHLNHIRMSFESSNFLAIQSTIDWSVANMPNLKGIVIGVSEDNFGHFDNVRKQYNVAWPFRNYIDNDTYTYFKPVSELASYVFRLATAVYFQDIRDFLKNHMIRFRKIEKYTLTEHANIFSYNRNMPHDICEFNIDTLSQCVETALHKNTASNSVGLNFIKLACGNPQTIKRSLNNIPMFRLSKTNQKLIADNWKNLFDSILDKGLQLQIVIQSEHKMFEYTIKPANAHKVMNSVLSQYRGQKGVIITNLKNIFNTENSEKECKYYSDPLHLSNLGKSVLTKKLIESFRE